MLGLLALIYIPELPIFQSPRERAERAALQREGEKLQSMAKDPTRRKGESNAEIERRILEQMHHLGREMKRGQATKKQAMLKVDRLTKEIRQEQQKLARAGSPITLDRVAERLQDANEAMKKQGNPDAAKALGEMAGSLEKRDLEAAAQQLKQLAEKLQSGKMSEAEAKAAADALSKMAAAMEGSDLDEAAKQLEQAAEPLKQIAALPQGAERQQALQELMQKAAASCSAAGGT
jgi:hypothetical protein